MRVQVLLVCARRIANSAVSVGIWGYAEGISERVIRQTRMSVPGRRFIMDGVIKNEIEASKSSKFLLKTSSKIISIQLTKTNDL